MTTDPRGNARNHAAAARSACSAREELSEDFGGNLHEHPLEDVVRLVVAPDEDVDQNEVETEGHGDGGHREDGSGESVPRASADLLQEKGQPQGEERQAGQKLSLPEGMASPPDVDGGVHPDMNEEGPEERPEEPPRQFDGSGGQEPDEPCETDEQERVVREKSVPRRKENSEEFRVGEVEGVSGTPHDEGPAVEVAVQCEDRQDAEEKRQGASSESAQAVEGNRGPFRIGSRGTEEKDEREEGHCRGVLGADQDEEPPRQRQGGKVAQASPFDPPKNGEEINDKNQEVVDMAHRRFEDGVVIERAGKEDEHERQTRRGNRQEAKSGKKPPEENEREGRICRARDHDAELEPSAEGVHVDREPDGVQESPQQPRNREEGKPEQG